MLRTSCKLSWSLLGDCARELCLNTDTAVDTLQSRSVATHSDGDLTSDFDYSLNSTSTDEKTVWPSGLKQPFRSRCLLVAQSSSPSRRWWRERAASVRQEVKYRARSTACEEKRCPSTTQRRNLKREELDCVERSLDRPSWISERHPISIRFFQGVL